MWLILRWIRSDTLAIIQTGGDIGEYQAAWHAGIRRVNTNTGMPSIASSPTLACQVLQFPNISMYAIASSPTMAYPKLQVPQDCMFPKKLQPPHASQQIILGTFLVFLCTFSLFWHYCKLAIRLYMRTGFDSATWVSSKHCYSQTTAYRGLNITIWKNIRLGELSPKNLF